MSVKMAECAHLRCNIGQCRGGWNAVMKKSNPRWHSALAEADSVETLKTFLEQISQLDSYFCKNANSVQNHRNDMTKRPSPL